MDGAGYLIEAALRLQGRAGSPQTFGAQRPRTDGIGLRVAIGYEEEALARVCLESARELILGAAKGVPYDVEAEIGRLRELAGDVLLGPTTATVIAAARARDIPVRRLIPGRSLFQLGHGSRLCRIYASATDRTGVVSQAASTDKELTKELLRGLGLPVPEGRPAMDAEDAWEAAREIGTPVVVKPRDFDYGHGISLDLTTREQVIAAYAAARERSDGVLVERFIKGDDHRVLVIDGRVVAVSRRRPPQVVGDGRTTIAGLVEQVNADPRRGIEATSHLRIVRLGETELATLAEQGYEPGSIPPSGVRILIRRNSHLRDGGSMTDETDRVHPRIAEQAAEAAHVLGIDIAGLDIVAEDLTKTLEEQGGAILEVNASPGFDLHIAPWASHPRPVGEAVVASLFPVGEMGRIPIVAVLGGAGASAVSRMIARFLVAEGKRVGLASAEGLFVNDRRVTPRPSHRFDGARDLLSNPAVDLVVLEISRASLFHDGLAFNRCEVAVILDERDALSPSPHPPIDASHCLARTVSETGALVVAADAPSSDAIVSSCKSPRVIRFGAGSSRAVLAREGQVVSVEGDREEVLGPLDSGSADATLAAVAAAIALGLSRDRIRLILEEAANRRS